MFHWYVRISLMHRTGVRSSAIRSMGYDKDRQILEVRYAGGDLYRYFEVPDFVNDALEAAPSKGKFVNGVVKPYFKMEKIEG